MNGMVLLCAKRFCGDNGIPFSVRDLSRIPDKKPPAQEKIHFPDFHSMKGGVMITLANRRQHLKEKRSQLKQVRDQIALLTQKTERYQAIRRLSSDRFAAWERTYPRKQAILEAADAGKLDEVRVYARPYLDAVYRLYDNDHLGLAIDEDILHACMPIFVEDRGQEFADEYAGMIPAPHRESIDLMLKRKNIDHPYLHR